GRVTLRLLGHGPATTGRADAGTIGSASVSPSQPDQPPPRGRPEVAGKPCFPVEVPSTPPELPAQNSPSFLHQIDRAPGARQECKRDLRRVVEVHRIHHWATLSLRASKSGRGKKVICARHSLGVGHAQDLARIPKWKLGRVLSVFHSTISFIPTFSFKTLIKIVDIVRCHIELIAMKCTLWNPPEKTEMK
ncbi:RNA-dependent RNA polymerase family protein, partial [Prunus dulcis]